MFDDSVERPIIATGALVQADALVFVGQNSNNLYGTTLHIVPATFYEFTINSAGATLSQTATYVGPQSGWGTLDSDGTSIYVNNGYVINPNTLAVEPNSFPVNFYSTPDIRVDVPASRVYFAGGELYVSPGASMSVQAYALPSETLIGTVGLPEFTNPPEMYRFGTGGLAMGGGGGMLFLQTSLTNPSAPAAQFFVGSLTPEDVAGGSPDQTVTITGGGFATGDTVTANGMPLAITSIASGQIVATIPASVLSVAGNVQIAVADTNNHVGYLQVVVYANTPNVGLSTNVLNFAAQNVGTSSTSQNIMVTNGGPATLVVSGITASGDFTQTNNCGTVAVAGTCQVSVTFNPTASGNRSGTLTINDNDPTKAQSVTLSGIGSDVQVGTSGGSSMSATVKTGQNASYALTVMPVAGFSGTVTFSCGNLPQYAQCSFNPPSGAVTSGGINVTVTISTSQQSAAIAEQPFPQARLAACAAMLLFLPFGILGRRRGVFCKNVTITLVVVALICLPLAGCSGGGSGGGGTSSPPPTATSTPAGTYTVAFTVTEGTFSHSFPLTLVVTN